MIDDVFQSISKIIQIPSDFHLQNKSWLTLLDESGYFKIHQKINISNIEEALKKRPELVEQWIMYSGDNRSSPSWYFTKNDSGNYFVGHWPERPEYLKMNSKDQFKACAYFIVKKIEATKEMFNR